MKWTFAQMAVFSAVAALFVTAALQAFAGLSWPLLLPIGVAAFVGYWMLVCRLWSSPPDARQTPAIGLGGLLPGRPVEGLPAAGPIVYPPQRLKDS
jgi:hypothetical protein